MRLIKNTYLFISEVASECGKDYIVSLGAALAFYTLLSLAPLLVMIVGVAGFFLGRDAAKEQIVANAAEFINQDTAVWLEELIGHALRTPQTGLTATIIGTALLIFASTLVMANIRTALNIIWKVETPGRGPLLSYIKGRLVSFVAVIFIGVLLVATISAETYIQIIVSYLPDQLPYITNLTSFAHRALSFVVLVVGFFLLFKFLPDAKMSWKDLLVGSSVTTVFFLIGTKLLSIYLASQSVLTVYGASGALMVFLLYVYYSSQLVFVGAEFTKVFSKWRKNLA